jgi:hypothetical protein
MSVSINLIAVSYYIHLNPIYGTSIMLSSLNVQMIGCTVLDKRTATAEHRCLMADA